MLFFSPGQSKSQQWKLIQLGIIFYTQAYLVDEPNLRFPSEWKNKMHFLFILIVKTSLKPVSSFVPLPHPGEFISLCYEQ